jgi:serine/threonine protein kinase
VTDFGLARDLDADSELTRTGQSLGSPAYCAPEQIRSDARPDSGASRTPSAATKTTPGVGTDVYGLGAVLYHLLTQRPPFGGTSLGETLLAVQQDEPIAPRKLNRGIPADLETICLKCLEKEPAKRYATAQELADELDRFLRDEPILARPVSRAERVIRWCRRKPALAGALGAAALFKLWDLASQRELASHVARSRYVPCLAFSPDGAWWASASGEGEVWLFSSKAGERFATPRGHRETPDQLAFTPDSRQLLSTSHDGSLRAWPIPPRSPKADQLELPPSISTAWNTYGPAMALAPDAAATVAVVTNSQRFVLWRTDETFGIRPPEAGVGGASSRIVSAHEK